MKYCIAALAAVLITDLAAAEAYFRSPDVHGDLIVFTAEGDLWSYTIGNDSAARLTTHPSQETDAAISPDGTMLAFTADYEGSLEAYVMPISGGVPRRLSYENAWAIVQGWTPDGDVLYTTGGGPAVPRGAVLKTVDPASLDTHTIPQADAFDGTVGGEPDSVYFTQFNGYFSGRGDSTNVYRGGMSGKLWRYRRGSDAEAMRLLGDHEGSIRRPMVGPDKLYFISDATGRHNIWAANLDGSAPRQLTLHDDFSIRGAGTDGNSIVYQLGADLHLLDLATGDTTKLDIRLRSDRPGMRESWVSDPMKFLQSIRLSGKEDKVTITARGAAAIAGTGKSRLVNVAAPGDARLRQAVRSHDGKSVYAISDSSGEPKIWRYAPDGGADAEMMTDGPASLLGTFAESPDGLWIARGDGRGGLWLLNTKTGRDTRILADSSTIQIFDDIVWSPNSQLLAVTQINRGSFRPRVLLHDVASGKQAYITSARYESTSPAFGHDGKWIYFLSNRKFDASGNSVWQDRDFGPSFDRRTEIFALPLTDDARFLFEIPNELSAPPAEKSDANDDGEDEPEAAPIEVDWEGLAGRVWQVPLESSDYVDIAVNDEFLFVLTAESAGAEIKSVKLEPEPKAETFTDGVNAMQLSVDGKKLLVVKKADETTTAFVVPAEAKFPEDPSKPQIATSDWRVRIDPRAEWRQMFYDAWLMHRELFFDPAMRGVDWEAMRVKYRPLADRVTDRHELNDVLAQLVGELNALHSQVRGGDVPEDPDAPAPAVLGAELQQDTSGVTISRIYRHDREVPSQAPPLAQAGVDAQAGDRITHINGVPVATLADAHRALRNQAGKQVLLGLRRGRESIRTIVVPAEYRQDAEYRYTDWVHGKRDKVESTDRNLGYLHIAAMESGDIGAFARDFYAHRDKKGFIIDVRRNNGGNIDSWIIARLLRKAWAFWSYRSGMLDTNMQGAFRGHLVVLADERTYSDGETFTAAVKALDIAPVIGKRTAGAGVWLSDRNLLSDGGRARVAEFPVYALDGRWIVEGRGVSPTIEVDNLPHATFMGQDAQLEAAIEYLQRKLQEEPVPDLKPGPFPEPAESAHDP